MPIDLVCAACQKRLKAPDAAAGKRTQCPACKSPIEIPSAGSSSGDAASDCWEMKSGTGETYGPVTKVELDQWVREGRLDDQCQVLQKGAPQWQWASQLYPQLSASVDPLGQATAPLTQTAQPMGKPGSPGQPAFRQATHAFQTPTLPSSGFANSSLQAPQTSNPYASSSSFATNQTRSAGNGGIITVAVLNFVLGGLSLLCGVFTILAGGVIASVFGAGMGDGDMPDEAKGMAGVITVIIILVGVIYLVYSVMLITGGVGLLKRAPWGRIITLICAGLAGLVALIQLLGFIGGSWQAAIGLLIFGGYCVTAFVLLLNGSASRVFQQGR